MRWQIETGFEEAKGQVGLDQSTEGAEEFAAGVQAAARALLPLAVPEVRRLL